MLIVTDGGLRSSLIGRLSMAGESIVTIACDLDDPALERVARAPSILVTDVAIDPEGIERLCESGRWDGIIILAAKGEDVARTDKLCILDRAHALAHITDALARWRQPGA